MIDTAIRIEERFACPQARLWEVLADPAELSAWLGGDSAIAPEVGGAVRFELPDERVSATGEVRAYLPPRPGYTVAHVEHTFVDAARPEVTSVCRWSVVDHGDTCELRFVHDGVEANATAAMSSLWSRRLGAAAVDGDDASAPATTLDEAAALLRSVRTVLLVDFIGPEVPTTLLQAGYEVHAKVGPAGDDFAVATLAGATDPSWTRTGAPPARADLVHIDWDDFDAFVDLAVQVGASIIWYHAGRTRPPLPHDTRGTWVPAPQSAAQRARAEAAGLTYVDSVYIVDAVRRR